MSKKEEDVRKRMERIKREIGEERLIKIALELRGVLKSTSKKEEELLRKNLGIERP